MEPSRAGGHHEGLRLYARELMERGKPREEVVNVLISEGLDRSLAEDIVSGMQFHWSLKDFGGFTLQRPDPSELILVRSRRHHVFRCLVWLAGFVLFSP